MQAGVYKAPKSGSFLTWIVATKQIPSALLVTLSFYVVVALPQSAIPAQEPTATPQPLPTDTQREEFRASMARVKLPGHGCHMAQYPTQKWIEIPCGPAHK